jgi:hypothetical protein
MNPDDCPCRDFSRVHFRQVYEDKKARNPGLGAVMIGRLVQCPDCGQKLMDFREDTD